MYFNPVLPGSNPVLTTPVPAERAGRPVFEAAITPFDLDTALLGSAGNPPPLFRDLLGFLSMLFQPVLSGVSDSGFRVAEPAVPVQESGGAAQNETADELPAVTPRKAFTKTPPPGTAGPVPTVAQLDHVLEEIKRLYAAHGKDVDAEDRAGNLQRWLGQYAQGLMGYDELMTRLDKQLAIDTQGRPAINNQEADAIQLYEKLGLRPDDEGVAFWAGKLEEGHSPEFIESEMRKAAGLDQPEPPPAADPPPAEQPADQPGAG